MSGRHDRAADREHPEIFWVLFLLVTAAMLLAVVEPARRENAAARRELERLEAELDRRLRRIEALCRERQALERGDPEAVRAAACAAGLDLPGAWDRSDRGRAGPQRQR
jgi:hypothetical protein